MLLARLPDPAEERPFRRSAHAQPFEERKLARRVEVTLPLFVAFADDFERAIALSVIGQRDRDDLGPAQADAEAERKERCIASAQRAVIPPAGFKELELLKLGERASGRQPFASDLFDQADALVVIAGHELQLVGSLGYAAQTGAQAVERRGREMLLGVGVTPALALLP